MIKDIVVCKRCGEVPSLRKISNGMEIYILKHECSDVKISYRHSELDKLIKHWNIFMKK